MNVMMNVKSAFSEDQTMCPGQRVAEASWQHSNSGIVLDEEDARRMIGWLLEDAMCPRNGMLVPERTCVKYLGFQEHGVARGLLLEAKTASDWRDDAFVEIVADVPRRNGIDDGEAIRDGGDDDCSNKSADDWEGRSNSKMNEA